MKVRNGFVSNSSSSSFIVLKRTEDDLTEEYVEEFVAKELCKKGIALKEATKTILEKFGNKGRLIVKTMDYGNEDSVTDILEEFSIPYIDIDDL